MSNQEFLRSFGKKLFAAKLSNPYIYVPVISSQQSLNAKSES